MLMNFLEKVSLNEENIINYFYQHISSITKNISYLLNDKIEYNNSILDVYNFKNISISIVIICRDEERCIERCLHSVFTNIDSNDEVIVIDTGSKDNTINIIKNKFSKVIIQEKKWNNSFASIRNLGLDLAKNDWIFFIDADEIITNESIDNLKLYLTIINYIGLRSVVINPTIINENYHIVQGVRRIIRKSDKIKYYGVIHEEPRLDNNMFGKDLACISFDNIILNHDGYREDIMIEKNKLQRNTNLLVEMIKLEPNYPRWLYFYCRDGRYLIDETTYIDTLKKVVELSKDEYYKQYLIRALSDLIDYYLINYDITLAEKWLSELKLVSPELSDVFYFDIYIQLIKTKLNFNILLEKSINYRKNQNNIDYGSLHSNYFHIDYLIAKLFFEIGEYEKSFNIIKKLENHNFGKFQDSYKILYKSLTNYYNTNKK